MAGEGSQGNPHCLAAPDQPHCFPDLQLDAVHRADSTLFVCSKGLNAQVLLQAAARFSARYIASKPCNLDTFPCHQRRSDSLQTHAGGLMQLTSVQKRVGQLENVLADLNSPSREPKSSHDL